VNERTYSVEIVTPRKVVYSGQVVSFTAPGVLGAFQVLRDHAPLLAAISIGELKLRDASGRVTRYATSGGFVEVLANHVVMLAESAEPAEAIDVERAARARERAEERLKQRTEEIDFERAKSALLRAMNRLRIAPGKAA
jgi:F-type H+-transporting ATPase subunit epsilon